MHGCFNQAEKAKQGRGKEGRRRKTACRPVTGRQLRLSAFHQTIFRAENSWRAYVLICIVLNTNQQGTHSLAEHVLSVPTKAAWTIYQKLYINGSSVWHGGVDRQAMNRELMVENNVNQRGHILIMSKQVKTC